MSRSRILEAKAQQRCRDEIDFNDTYMILTYDHTGIVLLAYDPIHVYDLISNHTVSP